MGMIASQITSLTIVYSTVYSNADQRKHQSSTSLNFVQGIHQGQVNSLHKWPVMQKMFPLDNIIMMMSNQQKHNQIMNLRKKPRLKPAQYSASIVPTDYIAVLAGTSSGNLYQWNWHIKGLV